MLVNGDCLEEVQKLVDKGIQVDSIVTDPPYHLTSIVDRFGKASIDDDTLTSKKVRSGADSYSRLIRTGFMGKEWDGGDIAFRKETWELFMKVLKPGGHLLAFSGSRTYHRMAVAIEDAGFDIRDQIMWLYGSGFPKSLNLGKSVDKKLGNERIKTGKTKIHGIKGMPQAEERTAIGAGAFGQEVEEEITVGTSEWEGWGTSLKPAHEPIVLARKPLSENSIVANVLKHRTGGIHIDVCRIEGDVKHPDTNPDFRDAGKQSKEKIGIDQLSYGQTKNIKRKTTKRKSRSDNGVWTNKNSGMKAEGAHYADADPKGRFPANVMHDGSEEVLKGFPHTKSGKMKQHIEGGQYNVYGKMYPRDVETIGDEGSAARFFYCAKTSKSEKGNDNTHPTVKPLKLMRYLCRLITPKGGTVLDPFMGSGSTGIAAKDEGFEFIGIEREKEYFDIAERRVSVASPLEEFMK